MNTGEKHRRGNGKSGSGKSGSGATHMLLWGVIALVALAVAAVLTGVVDLGDAAGRPIPGGGGRMGSSNKTWSFYHDRKYEPGRASPKWQSDPSRTSDPDQAPLGDTSRWEYDGPYRYGGYGSDGMRRRAHGREGRDPLYPDLGSGGEPDVFSLYSNLDPAGAPPVGPSPSQWTSPYFDPYSAGYSNPYANRMRMAYGEGYGPGAAALDAP